MSCCGQKRAEWSGQRRQPTPTAVAEAPGEAPPESPRRSRSPRVFEYVGHAGLVVAGVATGATYRFSRRQARLEVAAEDVFAMMAEPELQVVP